MKSYAAIVLAKTEAVKVALMQELVSPFTRKRTLTMEDDIALD